jgi:hypothetical protein
MVLGHYVGGDPVQPRPGVRSPKVVTPALLERPVERLGGDIIGEIVT